MTTSATRFAVGSSTHDNPVEAAHEAAIAAMTGARTPVIALVFATAQYDHHALAAALNDALGDVPWAGCSALGVFAGVTMIHHGIVVALLDCPRARAQVGLADDVIGDPRNAGRRAVLQALEGMPVTPGHRQRLLIVMPDTSHGCAAVLLRGALGEGGNGAIWAGGGAGDMTGERVLAQFAHGKAHTDAVAVIAIDLPAAAGTGVAHGWRPFGPPAMVTRAEGNIAVELEYRSAFDVYREAAQISGKALDLENFDEYAMFHPLGIPQANERYLVRDPVGVVDGGVKCVAEIPDGALVRIMRADRVDIVQAAGRAAAHARAPLATDPCGALIFDCISRQLILGDGFEEELVAYRDALGPDVPVFGCLTFGEIASFGREVPQFHNKTTVVVAIPS